MPSITNPGKHPDQRAQPRRDAGFAGILMLGAYAVPCNIVNLSKSGAQVRLHRPIALSAGRKRLTCARFGRIWAEVVWQNGREVGLRFAPASAGANPLVRNAGYT